MPKPTENAANLKSLECPKAAEAVEQLLFSLGHFHLQLDGLRLSIPSPVARIFESFRTDPFVFVPWPERRVRIVPQAFWSLYLETICQSVGSAIKAKLLNDRLNQVREARWIDTHNRWNIPASQAKYACFIQSNEVVLVPCKYWLEILTAANWDAYITETMNMVSDVGKGFVNCRASASSQPIPPIPGDARGNRHAK